MYVTASAPSHHASGATTPGWHDGAMSEPIADSPAGRRVSRRVAAITESATLAVDARAKALRAAGRPVIGFGAGEPDFPTPDHVVEAAVRAARDPAMHHYSPTGGLPALREAVADKTLRDSGVQASAADVLITNGGKQAVQQALATLLDPGDEVLLPTPCWTTYPEAVRLAGGVPVPVVADEQSGYLVSVRQLEAARTPRTKLLLFCSPANPTGAVHPPEQVEEIGRWALDAGLWVLTDEIYEHLVYGGATAPSMPAVVPELQSRCVVVNGVAKAYAMTGWRVGWLLGPPDVVRAATALQSHSTSNVANVAQAAALAALTGDQSSVAAMREAFDRRRRTAVAMLREIPGWPARNRRAPSTSTPRSRRCSAGRSPAARRPRAPSSPRWCWTPRRSPSSPGRRSGHRATCGCPTPWPTTTWWRASPACSACSAPRAELRAGRRPGPARAPSRRRW